MKRIAAAICAVLGTGCGTMSANRAVESAPPAAVQPSEADVARVLATDGPLVAEQRYGALAAPSIRAAITAAGQARCAALPATTPYASWIAARYCAHFGVARAAQPLPGLYGSLAITNAIAGETPAQRDSTSRALDAALRDSIWFAPDAPVLDANVTGELDAAFDAHAVTRTATWSETVQVDGTVKAWHADAGWVDEPITMYEPQRRSLDYAAVERHGTYSGELHVDLEPLGVGASEASSLTRQGDDTDVSDPDAGVAPTRARLPTADDYAASEGAALADHTRTALARAYREQRCNRDAYTLEQAATCAYGDAGAAPPEVHAALRETFGAEEPLLAPLLTHDSPGAISSRPAARRATGA